MKRRILAAEEMESRLSEIIPMLEDDFDYLISGFEKLDRSGKDMSDAGFDTAQRFYETLQSAISEISNLM